jgi:2-amino-4-hydroxy-6-hydroxymethyldihydropteridine diphosphokinase
MARVHVSIGSNIDRERHIRAAVVALRERFGTVQLSSVYESEAVGFDGDNFLNMVVAFDTDLDVQAVAQALRAIEDEHGRVRSGPRFSSRTVDLDLLLYDDLVSRNDDLDVPRAEITKNAFVLQPLAEIAPEALHPVEGITFAELWQRFDKTRQALWPVPFDFPD